MDDGSLNSIRLHSPELYLWDDTRRQNSSTPENKRPSVHADLRVPPAIQRSQAPMDLSSYVAPESPLSGKSLRNQGVPRQARYWIGTIPAIDWRPELPAGVQWLRGQLEQGIGGYRHWQIVFSFRTKQSLTGVKRWFPITGHYEPTRSKAAEEYVHKEDTRIGEVFYFNKAL